MSLKVNYVNICIFDPNYNFQKLVFVLNISHIVVIFAENTVKDGNIICTIKSGNVNDEDKEIGFKSSAEQCFRSVRKKRKNANGMTWEKRTHRCYAEFKANRIVKECLSCQSCIFKGMI